MKILNHELDTYDALLFDLDGTLINSMPWHNKAWKETFAENGVVIDDQFLDDTMGMASVRIVEIINRREGLALDAKKVALDKRERYLTNVEKVTVVPELLEIVRRYHGVKPMGIITGGSHEVVDQLLPKLKIDHYFDSIVCSDDTEGGKDSREPYLLAQKQLNIDLKKSLFFDDGDVGLKGAKLSGMEVVHVDVSNSKIFIS